MVATFRATREKRIYNRWVANETMEDFALRFTARRARRWGYARVANTAIGSISFLALEAIGAALTLSYGFDIAITAIMLVGALLFLTGLPISYYAARYGLDIDLLTRGAGFGYLGSTITSLIYASFTFIFFALEAAILALALEFTLGLPIFIGYVVSSLVVIPIVMHGFSKISAFQTWTQPLWVLLHVLPFGLLAFVGYDIDAWTSFPGNTDIPDGARLVMLGAASGVVFALIAQIGEQVDFLRFLPEPKTRAERRKWWMSVLVAGPGWSVLGVLKMIAGSYLVTLALRENVPLADASDPTWMYYVAFDQAIGNPALVLGLTGAFVVLSQLKINVTNAYAGSIAWSNFFSRLTQSHPGRVVWLVFNVAIALMLMELGVFTGLEHVLGLYSHVAVAWIGALVADLVVNKPLGLSPRGIEFRRSHLHDINPVGTGSMLIACVVSLMAYAGVLGPEAKAASSFIALSVAFALAPVIAYATRGRYYLTQVDPGPGAAGIRECVVCGYGFDGEDMSQCPFHGGTICSLCCTLDTACNDLCRPDGRFDAALNTAIFDRLPAPAARAMTSRLARFLAATALISASFGLLLLMIRNIAGAPNFDAVLTVIFGTVLIVIGIVVWMFILIGESRRNARAETERQTERLLQEIRAHDRTDRALQQAKEKAEAANLAKTRYMSGLSHELRTPLNAIYGFAQLLERDPGLKPWHSSISSIRRSSEHLAGLIEGLLDISRIEAGRLEIMRDRINLHMFLRQVSDIFDAEAADKGLAFTLTTHGRLPTLVGSDEKRLRQIVINLLSNAIRYTERGRVTLDLTYRNEVAIITVSDTGLGIEPDQMARIWRPFERANRNSVPGSGLGLTITKLLVEILGGDIAVDSTPGKGSTFTVRLMLPSITPGAFEDLNQAEEGRDLRFSGYEGQRKTVMVVDDDLNHLALADNYLSQLGFFVVTVTSADAARLLMEDAVPDILLLDIDMPERDGWSLAKELREGSHRSIPIIMISGHATDQAGPRDGLSLHDAFITKPYNLDDLVLQIADLLKITLTLDRQAPGSDDPFQALSPTDRAELLQHAQIGHASALRAHLAQLAATRRCCPALMRRLTARLERFDFDAIATLLAEEPHETL